MGIIRSGNGQSLYPSTNYKTYESMNFVVGSSPLTIDVKTALGRAGNAGYVTCEGPGSLGVKIYKAVNDSGEDVITLLQGDVLDISGEGVVKIVLTHLGTDSAYRINIE